MNPAEPSQTLGEFLRHERERRGMTIEQVASATKINVRMLHALEADHFAELPAKPFVRGFVTSYCRFIGLAPKEILTRFGDFIDDKAHDRPNRDAGHSGYAFEKREGEQSRTVLWFAMGGFIAVGGLIFVFLKPSLHHHHSTHLDKLRTAHPTEVGAEGGTPAPDASAGQPPNGTPTNVIAAGSSVAPNPAQSSANSPPAIPALVGPVKPAVPPVVALASPTPAAIAPTPTPPAAVIAAAPPPTPPSAPTPTPSTAPGPAPTPTPTPAAAKAETSDPGLPAALGLEVEPATKDDPLASGVTLNRSEIRHKVVLKAGDDVWVRYRVDGKPVMRFILRKDRVLVLRAKKAIRFQTSEPDFLTFNYNGQGSKDMTSRASAAKQQEGDVTLYFPSDLAKIINEPFPGEKPIHGKTVPPPRATAPASTPNQ